MFTLFNYKKKEKFIYNNQKTVIQFSVVLLRYADYNAILLRRSHIIKIYIIQKRINLESI